MATRFSTSNRSWQRKTSRYASLFSQLYGNIYRPLSPEFRQIRLLTLLPGRLSDDLECTLSTVSLNTAPQYEAISYVWGNSNITRAISLNGYTFHVTRNLEAALLSLRHASIPRTLWVDAICVNQQDIPERNSQVSLMASIYSGCQSCVVWLGGEDSDTEDAMYILDCMANGWHFKDWPHFSTRSRTNLQSVRGSVTELTAFLSAHAGILEPLSRLFGKSWFSRTWTVQELILPNTTRMKCGRHEVDWLTVKLAHTYLFSHFEACCKDFNDSLTLDNQMSLDDFDKAVGPLVFSWEDRRSGLKLPELIQQLATFRHRTASDPRDKIYGLLNLCESEILKEILVDYGTNMFECYSQVILLDMKQSNSLRALGFVGSGHSKFELPSWVPDWSSYEDDEESHLSRFHHHELFDAAGGEELVFSIESRSLLLEGIISGEIVQTGGVADYEDGAGNLIVLQRWEKLYQSLHPNLEMTADDVDLFLRTIMLDSFPSDEDLPETSTISPYSSRASPGDLDAFKLWWKLALEQNTINPQATNDAQAKSKLVRTAYQHVDDILGSRQFLITDSGAIGIGPMDSRVGDQVWIMKGGRIPLLLRKLDVSSTSDLSSGLPEYTLVGDCYLDGLMDGKAAEELRNDSRRVRII